MNEKPILLKPIETEFILQWHLTNKCDRRCGQCYISNQEKENDSPYRLTLDESKHVINNLVQLAQNFNVVPRINFSGGNPLMARDFFKILKYSREQGIVPSILGNPTPLTKKNLDMLCENQVYRYQISLDGLEQKHDEMRGEGSFKETIEGMHKLSKRGIWVSIMSTISKYNCDEIPELSEIAYNEGARHFDFARVVPIGEGTKMKDQQFSPQEFREFLFMMHNKYEELRNKGARPSFLGKKDPLWSLLDKELGTQPPLKKQGKPVEGCSIGKNGLCLDVDGSIYSCRRMPIILGNIRGTDLRDFFINSKELNKQREFEKIEECGDCDLMTICRGCRAVAYANTGDPFSKDPQCWK